MVCLGLPTQRFNQRQTEDTATELQNSQMSFFPEQ